MIAPGESNTEGVAYHFPNKMGRILLLSMEEVMGQTGVNAVLNLANLRHFQANYPPNNFDMAFSFAESSRLIGALDEMYGVRGGQRLAERIGRSCFRLGIKDLGPMLGIADLAFRILPMMVKLRIGFEVFAEVFNKFSDHRVRLEENDHSFLWVIEQCGVCWERTTSYPSCHLAVGILQEALFWVSGGQNFDVTETFCIAMGDATCTIEIAKKPH
ncbi:MAG: 4-vinyl reductase [Anaerolineae bacterium]|nr:4-vinyl reductase [Anaerolineae bacterium]